MFFPKVHKAKIEQLILLLNALHETNNNERALWRDKKISMKIDFLSIDFKYLREKLYM